jgi:hypothetical protein
MDIFHRFQFDDDQLIGDQVGTKSLIEREAIKWIGTATRR